jgi:hypothetical protein
MYNIFLPKIKTKGVKMDRRYIKEYAIRTGQPLGDVARKLGVTQPWLSRIIAGVTVSIPVAKSIESWSNGEIPADRVMENTNE